VRSESFQQVTRGQVENPEITGHGQSYLLRLVAASHPVTHKGPTPQWRCRGAWPRGLVVDRAASHSRPAPDRDSEGSTSVRQYGGFFARILAAIRKASGSTWHLYSDPFCAGESFTLFMAPSLFSPQSFSNTGPPIPGRDLIYSKEIPPCESNKLSEVESSLCR
jgi:hypothetical protein